MLAEEARERLPNFAIVVDDGMWGAVHPRQSARGRRLRHRL
jgi:hypothetical protein